MVAVHQYLSANPNIRKRGERLDDADDSESDNDDDPLDIDSIDEDEADKEELVAAIKRWKRARHQA